MTWRHAYLIAAAIYAAAGWSAVLFSLLLALNWGWEALGR